MPVYDNFEELLDRPDVDMVSLCTPGQRHSAETVLAAQAGKHILIEKPIATSLDDLRAMRDAVHSAGVKTAVCFVLRWNPAVANIKALKAQGILGEPFYVQTDYWHNVGQAGISNRAPDLGAMVRAGCHAMDLARYLMESDIVSVSGRSWGVANASDHGVANNVVATVRFENGAMGKVSACTSQWMPYNLNIDLFGTEGVVRGNRFYTKKLPGLTGFGTMETVLPDSGDVAHHPFSQEIDHFVDCILSDCESHVNLEDAVNTSEACLAAEQSAEHDGAPVALPLL